MKLIDMFRSPDSVIYNMTGTITTITNFSVNNLKQNSSSNSWVSLNTSQVIENFCQIGSCEPATLLHSPMAVWHHFIIFF